MAEQRPGGEATEAPTPKKLADARKRGEVARSAEVVSFAVVLATMGVLATAGEYMVATLMHYARGVWLDAGTTQVAATAALSLGTDIVSKVTIPVVVVAALVAAAAGAVQVRGVFSFHPIKPTLQRINPISNAKNIFGTRALVELAKSLVKITGIGWVAGYTLWEHAPRMMRLSTGRVADFARVVGDCALSMSLRVALVVAALAAADYAYQRWNFMKKMRMTKDEVKREQKEMDGDPQHKAERQRLHREIAAHQMVQRTATADCIIVNPRHIAVAIKYDEKEMEAPHVVASGRGLIAAKIRKIARQHGIPIVRNVPLAHAMVNLELDEEVPADLYEAVAEVLRFVYALSCNAQSGNNEQPGDGE